MKLITNLKPKFGYSEQRPEYADQIAEVSNYLDGLPYRERHSEFPNLGFSFVMSDLKNLLILILILG